MHKALWLIPPFIGVAFYAAGALTTNRELHSIAVPAEVKHSGPGAEKDKALPSVKGLSSIQIGEAAGARAEQEYRKFVSLSPAELKGMILKLVQKYHEDHGAEDGEKIDWLVILKEAVAALARREKGAAWEWVLLNAPEGCPAFMHAWVESEPAAAFEAVVRCPRLNPCDLPDLMKMLQGFGEEGPDHLREACRRVPWVLFSADRSNYAGPGITVPEEGSLRPWIESGVLPELRDRGMDVSAIYAGWMRKDPRSALARWKIDGGPYAADPERSIASMLDPEEMDESRKSAVIAAIGALAVEDRERIAELMTGYARKDRSARSWKETYPDLIRLTQAQLDGEDDGEAGEEAVENSDAAHAADREGGE